MAALGRRQDGVFDVSQLRELGIGETQLVRCVAERRLVRCHQGVYADALVRLTARAHLRAALLALGPRAYLSHRTALALHGVRPIDTRAIEVSLAVGHTPARPGLTVHRTRVAPEPDELRIRDGLRCSAPALALLQVAVHESDDELARLVAELARRRLLDLERIDRAIERRKGLSGVRRIREA